MDSPALELYRGDDCGAASALPARGVAWVLRTAAVLVVLTASAAILVAFAYELAAEQALARAAAAGLREAALPRATSRSVEAVVRRNLARPLALDRATRVNLASAGGRRSVSLAVPVSAVLPRWLPIAALGDGGEIRFQAAE